MNKEDKIMSSPNKKVKKIRFIWILQKKPLSLYCKVGETHKVKEEILNIKNYDRKSKRN